MGIRRFNDPNTGRWAPVLTHISAVMGTDGKNLKTILEEIRDGKIYFDNLTPEQQALLKGEKGDDGQDGATGPEGPQGATSVYDSTTQNFLTTLETTIGQDQTKTMTQKAITDELTYGVIEIPLTEANADNKNFYDGGGTWANKSSTQYGYIFKVIPGALYKWEYGTNSSCVVWLQSTDISVGTSATIEWWGTNHSSIIQAPNDANYIYFRIKNGSNNYTPGYWGKCQSVKEKLDDMNVLHQELGQDTNKPISQKASFDAMNYEVEEVALSVSEATKTAYIDHSTGKWVSTTSNKYGYIFPVEAGAWYKWECGANSSCVAWLQNDNVTVGQTPSYIDGKTKVDWWGVASLGSQAIIQAPANANFIFIEIRASSSTVYKPNFWGKFKSVKEKISEIEESFGKYIDTSSLVTSNLGFNASNVWIAMNTGNTSVFLPVTPGKTYKVESFDGSTNYHVCFITDSERVAGESVGFAGDRTISTLWSNNTRYLTAPSNAAYLFMRNTTGGNTCRPKVSVAGEMLQKIGKLEEKPNKSVNILYIGNSATQDGVAYLPMLLKEVAPDINFNIAMWYVGGKTLAEHYEYMVNDTPPQIISICENKTSWDNYNGNLTMRELLQNFEFDIVVLQEFMSYQESVTTEPFENIITYIRSHYNKHFKVACLIYPPLRTNIQAVYARTVAINKTFLKETEASSVIHAGGAVMLAMKTALDNMGDRGHLSPDNKHTQEGLPCLLQSYVHALWLFRLLGLPYGISNSQLRITTEVYNSINVPGPNIGSGVITGTEEQHVIAQKCAVNADKLAQALEAEAFSEISEL